NGCLSKSQTKNQHQITVVNEFPSTSKFYNDYLIKSETVLFHQALSDDPHISMWQNDEQLEDIHELSNTIVNVELTQPQQQPQHHRLRLKFPEFLSRYKEEDMFLIDEIPKTLRKYFIIPKPLQCPNALDTFQSAILLFSSRSSSTSIMHDEEFDSIHCLLRGQKRFIMIDTHKHSNIIEMLFYNKTRDDSIVDLEKIDYDKYPAFLNLKYYEVNMTSGDCLFIPALWIYQVHLFESNIGIVYNINHDHAIDIELDSKTCSPNEFDSSLTLDMIEWPAPENQPQSLKSLMLDLISKNVNGFEQWKRVFSKFYDSVDIDGNGKITKSEIQDIDGVVRIFFVESNKNERFLK
ncbi:unnamed protein product, partial [Didymodactylos carnosus]